MNAKTVLNEKIVSLEGEVNLSVLELPNGSLQVVAGSMRGEVSFAVFEDRLDFPRGADGEPVWTERMESLHQQLAERWRETHSKGTPARTVETIRHEIANLEGELAAIAGEALVIVDLDRGVLRDRPDYGCILKYSASEGQFRKEEWYPSTEAARAALYRLAAENGTVPDAGGWGFDCAPERDVQAHLQRISQQPEPGWGRPDPDDLPLKSLKGTDNPISRAAAAGLTYDQARKAVDGGE